MRRHGFTLLEVMVALVVTGLVVSMAWAAAQAGLDTEGHLARVRDHEERELVARTMLAGAFRHAVPGTIGGAPVFVLRDGPSDELTFQTRGVTEPLGASGRWEVTLLAMDAGLLVAGRPMEGDGAAFSVTLPRARAVNVHVRGRDARDGWLESWPAPDRSPAAVRVQFLDDGGRAVGAPLLARVGREQP